MKYLLSKFVPVRFHSHYRVGDANGQPFHSTWWQWRGRIFRHVATSF